MKTNSKHYGLAYILAFILPITSVYLMYLIIDFNIAVVQGMVLGLSMLLCGEINASYQSKKLIWAYVSRTIRDKLAFSSSLVAFLVLMSSPAWFGITLPIWSKLLWILGSVVAGFIVLSIIATQELREVFWKRKKLEKTIKY